MASRLHHQSHFYDAFAAAASRRSVDVFRPRTFFEETPLVSDHVYKSIELTGSSPNSIEDAVSTAIARAAQTIRNMRWFTITETRGHLEDGKIAHWQVTIKVGFTLDR